ncbi:MAG: hypothetical protein WD468_11455, partial [Pirellulales bacterium]
AKTITMSLAIPCHDATDSILELICRAYSPGWLLLARWHLEMHSIDGYGRAKEELRRFLESGPPENDAASAWQMLGHACFQTGDSLGEIHAFVECAQLRNVPFYHLSNTANRINQLGKIYGLDVDPEQKRDLAERMAKILESRKNEAGADDFSRMAWLALYLDQEDKAREYVRSGLVLDPENLHLIRLSQR